MITNKNGDLLCDRCCKPTTIFTMSWFNAEEICKACSSKEKEHPKFKEAKAYIYEQEKQGNLNAFGIGLPEDLFEDNHEDDLEEDTNQNANGENAYDKEAFSSFHDYLFYIEGQKI